MLTTHAVRRTTHANRKWRESITLSPVGQIDATQREKLFLRQTKLAEITTTKRTRHQRRIKLVVARRDRRVRSENTLPLHRWYRVSECLAGLNHFACELEREKRRVTFV